MSPTLRPAVAIVVGVLVAAAGLYLALAGPGTIATFGWVLLGLAVVATVANVALDRYHHGG